jgi:hypothetical protein
MTGSRGTEAYAQAYAYITAGGRARTGWGRRRLAMRYLLVTADPPLTAEELQDAKTARKNTRTGDRS